MTRMEKYASYREYILNEESFFANIENQSRILEQYKQRINKINPSILTNNTLNADDINIYPLISIQKFDLDRFNKLKEYVNLINDEKRTKLQDQISSFLNKYKTNSIIDKKSNDYISKDWLSRLSSYNELQNIQIQNQTNQAKLANFYSGANEMIDELQIAINHSTNSNNEHLNNYRVLDSIDKKHNTNIKKIYVSTIWIITIAILAVILIVIFGEIVFKV